MDEKTKMIMSKLPLVWGEPKRVNTKRGNRMLRTAKIEKDSAFWDLWKKHKDAIKSVAISIGKDKDGKWQACHWGDPGDTPPPATIEPEKEPETVVDRIQKSGINLGRVGKWQRKPTAPRDNLEYMPFQEEGIMFHRGRKRTLIADEMGLGKTVQALGIINDSRENQDLDSYDRVLVLCPASLKTNWVKEGEKWLKGTVRIRTVQGVNHNVNHVGDEVLGGDSMSVTVCNYEVLHAYVDKFLDQFDLIVLDEAQYIKNMSSRRSKAARELWRNRKEQHVLFLTGTPIMNRPEEIYPIYDACYDPGQVAPKKNWIQFTDRWCNAYQDRFGRHTHGASNLGELHGALRSFTIRRLKKDVLTELPPKRRQFIELDMKTNLLAKRLEKSTKEGERMERELKQLAKSTAPGAAEKLALSLKEMSELRLKQGIMKVPVCVDHINRVMEGLGPDGKLLVFAHHKEVVEDLKKAFADFNPVAITGKTPHQQRAAAVDLFQKNKRHRIFIGNIQAAGVGLTLTAASTVVFVESDWSPAQNLQCEDRVHRIGQDEPCLIQYLNVRGSLDMKIARSCMKKMEITNSALDGADGASV